MRPAFFDASTVIVQRVAGLLHRVESLNLNHVPPDLHADEHHAFATARIDTKIGAAARLWLGVERFIHLFEGIERLLLGAAFGDHPRHIGEGTGFAWRLNLPDDLGRVLNLALIDAIF